MNNRFKQMICIGLIAVALQAKASTLLLGIHSLDTISSQPAGTYRVQIGVYKNSVNALKMAKQLRSSYRYPVVISQSKNKLLSIVTVGPIVIAPNVAHSQDKTNSPRWYRTMSLSAGSAWQRAGNNQALSLNINNNKFYLANKKTSSFTYGALFLGAGRKLNDIFTGEFGFEVATTGNAELTGVIWDDAEPEFENYTYHYKIKSTRIAIKSKLYANNGSFFTPFISGAAGISINKTHSYTNEPTIFEALPPNNFREATKSSFSYSLALGAQKALNKNTNIGVSYEFSDFGKSALAPGAGQTLASALDLPHLYSNAAVFNITFKA